MNGIIHLENLTNIHSLIQVICAAGAYILYEFCSVAIATDIMPFLLL